MKQGDAPATYADVDVLIKDAGFKQDAPVETGMKHFVEWNNSYYGKWYIIETLKHLIWVKSLCG